MKYTKEGIRELLARSDAAAEKGLLALYARQTEDEQVSQETKHTNGMGFNGTDAEFLSSLAQQIQRKRDRGAKFGHCLTPRQIQVARQKILKYAGQLAEVANARAEVEAQGGVVEEPKVYVAPEPFFRPFVPGPDRSEAFARQLAEYGTVLFA